MPQQLVDDWQDVEEDDWQDVDDTPAKDPSQMSDLERTVLGMPPKQKGYLQQWDENIINQPLSRHITKNGVQVFDPKAAADFYDPASGRKESDWTIPSWMPMIGGGSLKSLGAGMLEGAGNVIEGLTTPLNLATAGTAGVATRAAKTATTLPALAKSAYTVAPKVAETARRTTQALSAPMIASGAARATEGYRTGDYANIPRGIAEMAGGGAAAKMPKRVGGRAAGMPDELPLPKKATGPPGPDANLAVDELMQVRKAQQRAREGLPPEVIEPEVVAPNLASEQNIRVDPQTGVEFAGDSPTKVPPVLDPEAQALRDQTEPIVKPKVRVNLDSTITDKATGKEFDPASLGFKSSKKPEASPAPFNPPELEFVDPKTGEIKNAAEAQPGDVPVVKDDVGASSADNIDEGVPSTRRAGKLANFLSSFAKSESGEFNPNWIDDFKSDVLGKGDTEFIDRMPDDAVQDFIARQGANPNYSGTKTGQNLLKYAQHTLDERAANPVVDIPKKQPEKPATNISMENKADVEAWYKFKQIYDSGKMTEKQMMEWGKVHNKVKDLKPDGSFEISPNRFDTLAPEEPEFTTYTLPDGREVNLSTSSTKGAETTTFQLKGGEVVEAVRKFMKDESGEGDIGPPKLPKALQGAKPRFNVGADSYFPNFADDLDKALYIISQNVKSKADASYMKFVQEQTGLSEVAARNLGQKVRSVIKKAVAGKETGKIDIPAVARAKQLEARAAAKAPETPALTPREYTAGKPQVDTGPIVPENVKPPVAAPDPLASLSQRLKKAIETKDTPNAVAPEDIAKLIDEATEVMNKLPEGPEKAGIIRQTLAANKAVLTSWDMSAPGRQGKAFILDKSYWTAVIPMMKAWKNKGAADLINQSIIEHPSGYFEKPIGPSGKQGKSFAEKMGLDLASTEEAFSGVIDRTAAKIPGVARSGRAHTAFLNKLRSDQFVSMMDKAKKAGKNPEADDLLAKSYAKFINDATGRGSVNIGRWKLERNLGTLNDVFFAPKNMSGQIRTWNAMLNPHKYWMADSVLRKQALKSLFAVAGLGIGVGQVAQYAGAKVSDDPVSADFRKIQIGNTRIDMFGGYQQFPVAAMKFILGKSTPTTGDNAGVTQDLTKGRMGQSRYSVAERFFLNRLSPAGSFIYAWMSNREFDGEKFEVKRALYERTMPIAVKDIIELAQEDPALALALGPATLTGLVGTQTYSGR